MSEAQEFEEALASTKDGVCIEAGRRRDTGLLRGLRRNLSFMQGEGR